MTQITKKSLEDLRGAFKGESMKNIDLVEIQATKDALLEELAEYLPLLEDKFCVGQYAEFGARIRGTLIAHKETLKNVKQN